MQIAGIPIGEGHVFIIAEIGANHEQDYSKAEQLIRDAHDAGADAVKLQTYTPDSITLDNQHEIKEGLWGGQTLYHLYEKTYMPWEWQPKLKHYADEIGIPLFSTPFSLDAVDFLEMMDVPAYKISSYEINDYKLIEKVARTGKPVIFSTGGGDFGDTHTAKRLIRKYQKELAILHCVSSYPSRPEEMNLRTIQDISRTYSRYAGLSDHSEGFAVSVAAVALGATIIEKHIKLPNSKGADAAFSLDLNEFKEMVKAIRIAEKAVPGVKYGTPAAMKLRRSLWVTKDIKSGEKFTEQNIASLRPAGGMEPNCIDKIIGKKASKNILHGSALTKDLIAD
jgi:pseudaminic acid synthase